MLQCSVFSPTFYMEEFEESPLYNHFFLKPNQNFTNEFILLGGLELNSQLDYVKWRLSNMAVLGYFDILVHGHKAPAKRPPNIRPLQKGPGEKAPETKGPRDKRPPRKIVLCNRGTKGPRAKKPPGTKGPQGKLCHTIEGQKAPETKGPQPRDFFNKYKDKRPPQLKVSERK